MTSSRRFLINERVWIVPERRYKDPVRQILFNRDISKAKEVREFLNPDFEKGLHNPFLLKGMRQAVKRICLAAEKKERVGIFGDYDVDGVTSSVLLEKVLNKIGVKTKVYIPSRNEGYGINKKGVAELKKFGAKLIIAVDCGITQIREIKELKKNNLDTIIVDHHLPQDDRLPEGVIINPNQPNDRYPFKKLSACGLVYKLAFALSSVSKNITTAFLKWSLDLTALSTFADMVPLIDENRIIAYYGLKVLRKTRSSGLNELFKVAGVKKSEINSGVVSFAIAPRLNAPGRLAAPYDSYRLLSEPDRAKAKRIALKIESQNSVRQEDLDRTLKQAFEQVENEKLNQRKAILVYGNNWQPGIVGLVAGKLAERYYRPAIALSTDGKIARGSARSIEGVHLLDLFESVKSSLISFGGHAKAGGLTLKREYIAEVYKKMLRCLDKKLSKEDMIPKIKADLEIDGKELNFSFIKRIEKLKPFGVGNPKPLFILRTQKIFDAKAVGAKKDHLKIKFGNFFGIQFNADIKRAFSLVGRDVDVLFTPEINEFRGRKNIELNVVGLKLHTDELLQV